MLRTQGRDKRLEKQRDASGLKRGWTRPKTKSGWGIVCIIKGKR